MIFNHSERVTNSHPLTKRYIKHVETHGRASLQHHKRIGITIPNQYYAVRAKVIRECSIVP